MEYLFKSSAIKSLKKLSKKDRGRILDKLDFFFSYEKPLEFAEPLHDTELGDHRFRIGHFRVGFDIENNKAIILVIGNRKDIYK